jgi:hypothetical protein
MKKRSRVLGIQETELRLFCIITEVDDIRVSINMCNNRGKVIGCRNEMVQSSTGLHWQRDSTDNLYSSEWKVVTYLSLQAARNNDDDRRNT